ADHAQLRTARACEVADCCAAGLEVGAHMPRHFLRVGAHAFVGHAVVGRGDDDRRAQAPGLCVAPDRCDSCGELLEPAEATAWLRLGVERTQCCSARVFVDGNDG